MRSASLAEWIIGHYTSKSRAASIVGDLVEALPEKGILWFWLATAGVLVRMVWRRPLAFLAAFYIGNYAFGAFQMAVHGMLCRHCPPLPWVPVFNILSGGGTMMWILLPYAAIRFGLRDRFTQMVLALTGSTTAIIYFWWLPTVLIPSIIVGILAASVALAISQFRQSALILLVAVAVGFAAAFLGLYLDSLYEHFVYPGQLGDAEFGAHPSLVWAGFLVWFSIVLSVTSTCSRMHSRLEKSFVSGVDRDVPVA
jgi:hypothetical protein